MDYLDRALIAGFQSEVQSYLGEAIEFAVAYQENRGEHDRLELRQAAQDALSELTPAIVDAAIDAYRRTLKTVDWGAVELLFKQLAIRAKLMALANETDACGSFSPRVTVKTRKGETTGDLVDVTKREGQEMAHVRIVGLKEDNTRDYYIPLVSIQALDS